ncbi:MAG: hypothetical protein DMG65_21565 [Candidatus Angelobacter sp. Gp1-AA117]|nr:MAG: hypothetical protein DMG65_21565 [Candidatus Angelobacter sp. Gp1-AA117]
MLIPIRHENMTARRWPVITLALIVMNIVIFVMTDSALKEDARQLGEVRAHVIMLAAMHPELQMPEQVERMVKDFREHNPDLWKMVQSENRSIADAWDARMRLTSDEFRLQDEMDTLAKQYSQLASSSLVEHYAFIPAHPAAISYITANFLHGGWLHLIGNMWFLWLAGFVLEDNWGRILYTLIYFVAGAAALQIHAFVHPGSTTAVLGASGAVAALMGAFLVRFPNMKIEMLWLFGFFRTYRFKAAAYWLLPLWLLLEIFYGTLFGQISGVAHWAHVGGFVFGVMAALVLRFTGLEHKANEAIDEKVSWNHDPAIIQATELVEQNQLDQALEVLNKFLATNPNSVDAATLVQQIHWRKSDMPAFHQATLKLCSLHTRAKEPDLAWQCYEEFRNTGGEDLPASNWFDLCRAAEQQGRNDVALEEYQKLIAAYPGTRDALMAQVAAGRICLAQLQRPEEALKFYEAADTSTVPHLDWEQTIAAGIRSAKAAMTGAQAATAR